jgi:hypothetical protein
VSHYCVNRAATAKAERCPSCNGWGALKLRLGATNHHSIPHGEVVQMVDDDVRYVGTRPWCVCTHCGGTGNVVSAITRRLEGVTAVPETLTVVRRHRNHNLTRYRRP